MTNKSIGSTPALGRREVILKTAGVLSLVGLGSVFKSSALAQSTSTIMATPEETEGPYWVDEKLNRSDILTDPSDNTIQQGFPLMLGVTVSQLTNGKATPLSGAYVDIWHCNASGIYSDMAVEGTSGKKFLRGYQVTDAHGSVRFLTIYPGWYAGRTVHIHARVRLYSGSQTNYDFTTQFFFDDGITDVVYQRAPYSQRPGRDTINTVDSIYNTTDCLNGKVSGSELLLRLSEDSSHAVASFNIVIDPSTAPDTSCNGNTGGAPPGGNPPAGGPPPGNPPPQPPAA
jgi:protocatechuate 3,4-dioxygenase beta subunit